MKKNNLAKFLLVAGTSLFLSACSTAQQNNGAMYDPLENSNRTVFAFNKAVDKAVIHPVVKGYRYVVPEPGRQGVRNVLRNLKSPVTLANEVLQGDVDGAGKVVLRAAVNTLLGVGGIFDLAGSEGYEYEQEDFGQTLAVWGVGHGPYLVLPILGPSSTRDYAGYIVDSFADPLRWYLFGHGDAEGWYYAKVGVEYLDLRESLVDVLEELEKSSIDYYAAVRSTYYQRRDALVRDEMATASEGAAIPNYAAGEQD